MSIKTVDRQVVIPFGNLRTACMKRGMHARLYIFEGGETVEVTKEGKQLVRTTAEYGDEGTASEQAALWLMNNKYLTMFDFEG